MGACTIDRQRLPDRHGDPPAHVPISDTGTEYHTVRFRELMYACASRISPNGASTKASTATISHSSTSGLGGVQGGDSSYKLYN